MLSIKNVVLKNQSSSVFIQNILNTKNMVEYINSINKKNFLSSKLYKIDNETGLCLSDIVRDKHGFSKAVIAELKAQTYSFQPAQMITIIVNGKERNVFKFSLIDTVVGGYISSILTSIFNESCSDRLYSYQRGRSFLDPITSLTHYLREYRKEVTMVKDRELFVLQRDIKSYTDTIPVHPNSELWKMLSVNLDISTSSYYFSLLVQMIRPMIVSSHGNYTQLYGITTGQPITAVIYNLYARGIDKLMDRYPDVFFARYSDDLILAHPDNKMIRLLKNKLDLEIKSINLTFNEIKDELICFNGAGRTSDNTFVGRDSLNFLGCRIHFNGTISLKPKRLRRLMRSLDRRIYRTYKNLKGRDENTLGNTICQVINRSIWGNDIRFEVRAISLLNSAVTHRGQLKEIDYRIALKVAEIISGVKGVKAFRDIPYARIRSDWKLKSFVQSRNKYGD